MTSTAPAPTVRGSDFAELNRRVRAAGLLEPTDGRHLVRVALTLTLYASVWVGVVWLGDTWWQLAAAVALGVAFAQVGFLGHDSGHQQLSRRRRVNDAAGLLVGNLLIGLSFGWWVGKHNRHHAHPNREEHDPDIGDGVLAFTTGQVAARTGRVGQFIVRRQAWLFFPLLSLEGLNLHAASVLSLRRRSQRSPRGGHRLTEAVLLVLHLTGYLLAVWLVMSPLLGVVFVVVHQGVWGFYMGCAFAPNHKGMAVIGADEDVDFLRRQVLTSRNVRGGPVVDWLLGGLNYQVEHHLFPSMPRRSLPRAQVLVRARCAQLGIPYLETSLIGSYVAAVRHLNALGAPLRG